MESKVAKLRFKDKNGQEYSNWQEKKLRDVLSIPIKIKCNNPHRNKLISVKLNRKGVCLNENVHTLNIGSTTYFIRKSGQFIYGKQNFFNGAFGIIPEELNNHLSSGDVPALDINRKNIIPVYLINFLGREGFYKNTKILSNGTGSKRLHENILLNIDITLPSLEEQRKISNFFTNIDKIIKNQDKKIESLESFKKGLMQRIFNGELRFKDENGEGYPQWEEKKFTDIFINLSSEPYKVKTTEYFEIGKFEIIDQGQNKIIGYSDLENKLCTSVPIIVYGDHTTIIKYRKIPFIVGGDGVKLISTQTNNDLKYLSYILSHRNVKPEGYKRHYQILKKIYLSIPSLEEQIKIANILSNLDEIIEREIRKLECLKEFKKGLMQRMFI